MNTYEADARSGNQKRAKVRTDGASAYTGLAESTLEKQRWSGTGPAYIKVGKVVLYDLDDIDAWLARHRRLPTAA